MSFKEQLRHWRRRLKSHLPYVRRREYTKLEAIAHELRQALLSATTAQQAQLGVIKPLLTALSGEVCFFVSHAAQPQLKDHVVVHITHLLNRGIHVFLILNTHHQAHEFTGDKPFMARLSGVLVRQNIGFDHAAWAHLYALCEDKTRWTRLYLINDSIVGPSSRASFTQMMERIDHCEADFMGLTQSIKPNYHLQSFFLVFNQNALRHTSVHEFFQRILNLNTKQAVIDFYELQLASFLQNNGLRCKAIFTPLSSSNTLNDTNDTSLRWLELFEQGFPYIKGSVMSKNSRHPTIKNLAKQMRQEYDQITNSIS
jgi:lipopolysaccharide biosynthesis protein